MPARIVWRITTTRRARNAFGGDGARLYGGRWNPRGMPLVYTADSRALAMLEMLELLAQDAALRARYLLIPATIPDGVAIERLEAAQLPPGWRSIRRIEALQAIGAAWARAARTAVLAVPSAVLPGETNYLLNPLHLDFRRIGVGRPSPLITDVRLLSRRRT